MAQQRHTRGTVDGHLHHSSETHTRNPIPWPLYPQKRLWGTHVCTRSHTHSNRSDEVVKCHHPSRSICTNVYCLCYQKPTLANAWTWGRSEEPQQLLVDHISFSLCLSFPNKLLFGFFKLCSLLFTDAERTGILSQKTMLQLMPLRK